MHQIRLSLPSEPSVNAERCQGDHDGCTGVVATIATPCGDLILDCESAGVMEAHCWAVLTAVEAIKTSPAPNGAHS